MRTYRPHYIKLDGYYNWDLKKAGELTTGIRYRALSGIPTNALAAHYLYGPDEAFLLPRGQLGRTDFEHGLDMHFGYGYDLGKGRQLEVFVDIYNIYNRQGTARVDNNYAPYVTKDGDQQNANPVSGRVACCVASCASRARDSSRCFVTSGSIAASQPSGTTELHSEMLPNQVPS